MAYFKYFFLLLLKKIKKYWMKNKNWRPKILSWYLEVANCQFFYICKTWIRNWGYQSKDHTSTETSQFLEIFPKRTKKFEAFLTLSCNLLLDSLKSYELFGWKFMISCLVCWEIVIHLRNFIFVKEQIFKIIRVDYLFKMTFLHHHFCHKSLFWCLALGLKHKMMTIIAFLM